MVNIIKRLFVGERFYSLLSFLSILFFSLVPLFFSFPFRDNSYLSWEGAYRMYSGQIPFVDFGLPLGYGFWLLPTLSFYLFGPSFFSLIKIQVLINIASGVAFKSIADLFQKKGSVVFIAVFLYCITYIFINFWPWYNHIVVVYSLIGFYFLLFVSIRSPTGWKRYVLVSLSALFIFLAIFTKQDAGGLALFTSGVVILHRVVVHRQYDLLLAFSISFIVIAGLFVLPLLRHEFLYWFNYGQDHHYSRINLMDFANVLFGKSQFLKLYVLIIVLILIHRLRNDGISWLKSQDGLFMIFTLCILFSASILQVTSYIPKDVNIFFHSFFALFVFSATSKYIDFSNRWNLSIVTTLVLLWWSPYYWKYSSRLFARFLPSQQSENTVSISSWSLEQSDGRTDQSSWVLSDLKEFERIKMPQETVASIEVLREWRLRESGEIKVLNMSELTPLAHIMDFELEKGMPLW